MRLIWLFSIFLIPSLALADGPLTITKPWMRYLLSSIPAAGYMVLANNSDTDAVITGATSPACGMLMLHKSSDTSGMASMMDIPSLTIPAHSSITLAPGGYHLMCMQPAMKVGDKIPAFLTFADGTKRAVTFPVLSAQSGP